MFNVITRIQSPSSEWEMCLVSSGDSVDTQHRSNFLEWGELPNRSVQIYRILRSDNMGHLIMLTCKAKILGRS